MRRSQKDLEGRKKLIVLEGRKFCKRAYKERPWNTGYRFTWAGRRDSKRREKEVWQRLIIVPSYSGEF